MTSESPQSSKDVLAARKAANTRVALGLGLLVLFIYVGFILYRYL